MQGFRLLVWGDYACFSRPEAKVERFTYPVMTPSAARGVLDAIYAKPEEFGWRVDQIDVLRPVEYIALRRNEVKNKISEAAVRSAMNGRSTAPVIFSDETEEARGRTQRQTIALRDVRYRIHAHIHPRPGMEDRRAALEAQAHRRIETGKCFYQPYLGCREFVAYFAPDDGMEPPYDEDIDMGWTLYDVFDLDQYVRDSASPAVSLFRAQVKGGILAVPPWGSDAIRTTAYAGSRGVNDAS